MSTQNHAVRSVIRAVRTVIRTEVAPASMRAASPPNAQNRPNGGGTAGPITDINDNFFVMGVNSLNDGETWVLG